MDDEEAELRNPFPSPPSHYTKYTNHNLKLLRLLQERSRDLPSSQVNQYEILNDQRDVPDWPLTQLEKPRADWILDDKEGSYEVFGDRWFIKEPVLSLAELGGHQLYPADPSVDRRPALLSILRSMLVAYSALTGSLLEPPPPMSSDVQPEWKRNADWINVMAQNLMAAANDLRPVQARVNLEMMIKRQLELRREETATLHSKCDALEAKLAEMRASAQALLEAQTKTEKTVHEIKTDPAPVPSDIDVLCWAEEIG